MANSAQENGNGDLHPCLHMDHQMETEADSTLVESASHHLTWDRQRLHGILCLLALGPGNSHPIHMEASDIETYSWSLPQRISARKFRDFQACPGSGVEPLTQFQPQSRP